MFLSLAGVSSQSDVTETGHVPTEEGATVSSVLNFCPSRNSDNLQDCSKLLDVI